MGLAIHRPRRISRLYCLAVFILYIRPDYILVLGTPTPRTTNTAVLQDLPTGNDVNAAPTVVTNGTLSLGTLPTLFPLLNDTSTAESQTNEEPSLDVTRCGLSVEFSCQGRCGVFTESPCSCHAHCLLYDTCCEDFKASCPSAVDDLTLKQRRFLDAEAECPEKLGWPVIAGCLGGSDPHVRARCERLNPVTKSDLIPVTDTDNGIHFKNVHCAECNGIAVASLISWSGVFFSSEDPKFIDSLFQRAVNGSWPGAHNIIVWESPDRNKSHARCLPKSQLAGLLPGSCSNQTLKDLCATGAPGYLSSKLLNETDVVVYRNRYCLLCDAEGTEKTIESCKPLPTEGFGLDFLHYYSVQVMWNASNRTWTFVGRDSTPDSFATSLDKVTCDASQYLAPENCRVESCHPSYYLDDAGTRCVPLKPFPYTQVFVVQTYKEDVHGDSVNATNMLKDFTELLKNMTYDENRVLVSVKSANVDEDEQYWTFRFEVFTKRYSVTGALSLSDDFRDAVLTNLQERGLNFTRYCNKVASHHTSYRPQCTAFSAYTLTYNRQAPSGAGNSRGGIPGDIGQQENWSWRNYVSIVCISLSIFSLGVRVCLQPFIAFFHSYACRMQFFLCLSLLLGYVLFMLGGFPAPGSTSCVVAAVATHWAMLAALLWMNVNALQIWMIFRPGSWAMVSRLQGVRCKWHVYTWLGPVLLVGPELILDLVHPTSPYAPLYGQGQCWFNRGRALLLFFVVPSILVSSLNLVFLVLTTHALHTQKMQYGDSASSLLLEVKACSKLVVLVGVTWLLGIPVAVYDEPILGDIFTLANANLGSFITMSIMGNRYFYRSVKEQFKKTNHATVQTKLSQFSAKISGNTEARRDDDVDVSQH